MLEEALSQPTKIMRRVLWIYASLAVLACASAGVDDVRRLHERGLAELAACMRSLSS